MKSFLLSAAFIAAFAVVGELHAGDVGGPAPVDPPASAVSAAWGKARVLRGVLESDGAVTASVEVKCGKLDRAGRARVAVVVTPFKDRRVKYKAQKAEVTGAGVSVAWEGEGLSLEVWDDGFRGVSDQGTFRSARVGGDLSASVRAFTAVPSGARAGLPAYALDLAGVPVGLAFTPGEYRWTFDPQHPARVRVSYSACKGVFKGSFKASYLPVVCPTDGVRVVPVKFQGVVADGFGTGGGICRYPVQEWDILVR